MAKATEKSSYFKNLVNGKVSFATVSFDNEMPVVACLGACNKDGRVETSEILNPAQRAYAQKFAWGISAPGVIAVAKRANKMQFRDKYVEAENVPECPAY